MEYIPEKTYKCNTYNDYKICLNIVFKQDYDWHPVYKSNKTLIEIKKYPVYLECWDDKTIIISNVNNDLEVIIFDSRKEKLNRILKS